MDIAQSQLITAACAHLCGTSGPSAHGAARQTPQFGMNVGRFHAAHIRPKKDRELGDITLSSTMPDLFAELDRVTERTLPDCCLDFFMLGQCHGCRHDPL